jgi:glycosyltransferase involved in cell wall biosynthesis
VEASVIIPAWNAATTIGDTLSALARQAGAPAHEVIVVDDGSSDTTASIAAAAGARVLSTGGGRGPGAARNVGAAAASAPLLAFTDADCIPEPDWLARIVAAARRADLVQGAVLPPEGERIGPFDRVVAVVSEYGLYQTANLAITRACFDAAGGFQPIVRPRRTKEMGEDAWLGWRARRAGARTCFARDAVVRHVVFPRGAAGFVAEQWRVTWFPELVRHMPELREAFLYRRWFLDKRTLRAQLAVAGVATALATRRLTPLAAALPYARLAWDDIGRWHAQGHDRARVGAANLAADAVRVSALWWGSLRSRRLVL